MQTRAEYQRARRAALVASPANPIAAPMPIDFDTVISNAAPAIAPVNHIEASAIKAIAHKLTTPIPAPAHQNAKSAAKQPVRPHHSASLAAVAATVAIATISANAAGAVTPEFLAEPLMVEAQALTIESPGAELVLGRGEIVASRAATRSDLATAMGETFEFADTATLTMAAEALASAELLLTSERRATPELIEEIQTASEELREALNLLYAIGAGDYERALEVLEALAGYGQYELAASATDDAAEVDDAEQTSELGIFEAAIEEATAIVEAEVPVANAPAVSAPAINAPAINGPAANPPAATGPVANGPAPSAPVPSAPAAIVPQTPVEVPNPFGLPTPELSPAATEADPFAPVGPELLAPEPELAEDVELPLETADLLDITNEIILNVTERVENAISEAELPIPVMEPRALTAAEAIETLVAEAQADGPRLHAAYAYSLAGQSNGRIPADMLQNLSWAEGHMLRPDAATQLERLNEAYRLEFGTDLPITSTYRSFAGQVQARARSGMWAATPGTSNHGWAIAVDFTGGINRFGTPQHVWMQENAPAFGWVHPEWARRGGRLPEPWHWEFWGTPDAETGEAPSPGILRGTESNQPGDFVPSDSIWHP